MVRRDGKRHIGVVDIAKISETAGERKTPPTITRLTFTANEVCQSLGIGRVTLWRLTTRGVLRPVPGIRNRLYSVKQIEAFADGRVGVG